MEYKTGDIINFNWKDGLFSKLITLYNWIYYRKSTATHSGIVSKVTNDTIYIYESILSKGPDFEEHAYERWWLDERVKDKTVTVRRPLCKLTNVKEICESYKDIRYDILSIILMPFKLVFNSTAAMFCSEVVSRILYDCSNKKINISGELGKSYEKITPQDLQISQQLESI